MKYEPYMDDYGDYKRYKEVGGNCTCGCFRHCGFSCMTDDCDCTDCECYECVDGKGYN